VLAHVRRKFYDLQQAHASLVRVRRCNESQPRDSNRERGRRSVAAAMLCVCFSFVLSTQHIPSPTKRWVRVTLTVIEVELVPLSKQNKMPTFPGAASRLRTPR